MERVFGEGRSGTAWLRRVMGAILLAKKNFDRKDRLLFTKKRGLRKRRRKRGGTWEPRSRNAPVVSGEKNDSVKWKKEMGGKGTNKPAAIDLDGK